MFSVDHPNTNTFPVRLSGRVLTPYVPETANELKIRASLSRLHVPYLERSYASISRLLHTWVVAERWLFFACHDVLD